LAVDDRGEAGFVIPKRLRLHSRFDPKVLEKVCSAAWACIKIETQRLLGRGDVVSGMIPQDLSR